MTTQELPQRVYKLLEHDGKRPCDKSIEWLVNNGFKNTSRNCWIKDVLSPAYSSQVEAKYLGQEPEPVGGQSVYGRREYTRYYSITKEQYEKMEVKPKLHPVYRPARYFNFDGFCECTQKEKKGKGWFEVFGEEYHDTYHYVYFVE